MRNWIISTLLLVGLQVSVRAAEENFRVFRPVNPADLEKKVPTGYGRIFVEAGRQYNIDPVLLAAISAHESGAWRSAAARYKNNWMGLRTSRGAKRFSNSEESIYYAAQLLNRRPFKGRNTLSQIASIYCATNPGYWRTCVLEWERRITVGRSSR
jgi:Mannosyl-glycoprotein endo-beta-N-acetylglucosaminidase